MTGPLGVPLVVTEPGDEIPGAVRYLEEMVDEAGWGQPNRLFMFRRNGRDMMTVSEGPTFNTDPMGFFREFTLYLLGNPEAAKRLLRNNSGFTGLAVAFERVESRCLIAVMLDGRTGMMQHHRGQSAELLAQGSFDGAVLETLEAFVAILALIAPEYCSG